MSVQLVPETVSRGTAASAMKVTTHLPLMPRLRMSGTVGLHGMHRDNVMYSFYFLSHEDYVVVMAAEVLKVLLLNGCNFFFISFCCTHVSVQLWSETLLLIIRCVKLFKLCCIYMGCVLVCHHFL